MSSTYSIAIAGIQTDTPREAVITKLAALLKVTDETASSIIGSHKHVVKKNVDLKTAAKYESALRSCGCLCIVEPEEVQTDNLSFDLPESLDTEVQSAAVEISGTKTVFKIKEAIYLFLGILTIGWAGNHFFFGGESISTASEIIKQSLRSPASFSFVSGKEVWSGKDAKGNPSYIVRVEYDAQNGFGATLRDCKLVGFFKEGGDIRWKKHGGMDDCEYDSPFGLIDEAKAAEMMRRALFE